MFFKGKTEKLLKNQGIRLDVGCGGNKQHGFTGMDKRNLPGVDIVHDLEIIPYPLESESCSIIVGSHIWEHLKPWLTIDIMNEWHRIMQNDGQLALSLPYGWSFGYIQDPTHCNPANEATWQYFDPSYPLWQIYKPQPWRIEPGFPVWNQNGNMEVVMHKITAKRAPWKE